MRAIGRVLILVALFGAEPALGAQVLIGARGGVTVPSGLGVGPTLGFDATVSVIRRLAIELVLDQAVAFSSDDGAIQTWLFTGATLGLQYRIDVSRVVPFLSAGLEGHRIALVDGDRDRDRNAGYGYGGAFGLGVLVPLGDHWFTGVEARYGVGLDATFPSRQTYAIRFGWRSAAF